MAARAAGGAAAALDRERSQRFLEKADITLPDERLAGLRVATDADLGIDETFLRKAMNAFGVDAVTRSPAQGTFHRLYEVSAGSSDPALLRVAALPGELWTGLMALEARLAHLLRDAGVPVPSCEFRELEDPSGPRGVQLVGKAIGTSLADLDADEPRMTVALQWIGGFLRALHRLRGEGHGPLSLAALQEVQPRFAGVHRHWDDYLMLRLDEHVGDCERAGDLFAGEAARVRSCFEAARARLRAQPSALLHGDPGSHNFIVDERAIRAVIDWEDALMGDPIFDLASLCTFHPERRHAAIHAGYGAEIAPGSDAWERFWLYFLRIALAKTVHRRRFGYADRPGRAPAARRIQLALARLEAVPA